MRLTPRLMSTTKFPISCLPLARKPQLLIHNLTADVHTPDVQVFRTKVLTETPSIQRRARVSGAFVFDSPAYQIPSFFQVNRIFLM